MQRSLFSYTWRHSRPEQLVILTLVLLGWPAMTYLVFQVRQVPLGLGRQVLMAASALAAVVSVVILAASHPIAKGFFDDDWVLVVALLIAFVSYTPAHIARGMALAHAGKKNEAMKVLEKALSMDPSSDLAKEAIASVSQD